MTRQAGQVRPHQAVLGGFVIAVVVIGIVAALSLLVESGELEPPLAAPAEPAGVEACPSRERLAGRDAPRVSASQLVECPRSYDGLHVRYEGEVVRAVLFRDEHAWVQLNDDPYGLVLGPLPEHRTAVGGNSGVAVSIPARTARPIAAVGSHRFSGDVLEVTGVFRRTGDAGGPAIDAETARIVRPGRPLDHRLPPARVATALLLAVAAGVSALLAQQRRWLW